MRAVFELQGEQRPRLGRAESRRLRKAGKIPAIMYGGGEAPQSLVLDHSAVTRHMNREAFFTSILTLKIDGKDQAVVIKDIQRHPVKPQIMHLDLQRVREDEEITLSVPIHFLNEATAKGVKEQGGSIEHLLTDVEVKCLPRYLPEYLEIDVADMELNQILHLSDIKLPEGVSLVALAHGQDHPVVAIHPARREEEAAAEGAGDAAGAQGESAKGGDGG